MNNPYPPANPYAPPSNFASPPGWGAPLGRGLRPEGSGALWIRWVVLPAFALALIFLMAGAAVMGSSDDQDVKAIGIALFSAGAFCFAVYLVLQFVWIGMSWSMIPAEGRVTRSGKRISPGEAVGFLFIPFFNYYWIFVQSVGLCEALNGQLEAFGAAKRAPRGLAIAASIVQVIPYANFAIGPFLWVAYMLMVDSAKAEYARVAAAAEPGPIGAPIPAMMGYR